MGSNLVDIDEEVLDASQGLKSRDSNNSQKMFEDLDNKAMSSLKSNESKSRDKEYKTVKLDVKNSKDFTRETKESMGNKSTESGITIDTN